MKNLILLLILIASNYAYANSVDPEKINGSVRGQIMDQQLQQPLPFVTISILDNSNNVVTGGITDDNGYFKIDKLPEGTFSLAIQFIGYKTHSTTISITKKSKTVDLGIIMLNEEAAALDEVMVVAEVTTIKQKVDRKVITIGKDLSTAGPTAGDIQSICKIQPRRNERPY